MPAANPHAHRHASRPALQLRRAGWLIVWLALWTVMLLPALLAPAQAQPARSAEARSTTSADDAARLRRDFAAARDDPALAVFDRPLVLRSTETSDRLQGDVHAVLEHPYAAVRGLLVRPEAWCRILLLHLNVQYCRSGSAVLDAGIGRKHEQDLDELHWVRFTHSVQASDAVFTAVRLQAPTGPYTTRDMRIEVEATPLATAADGSPSTGRTLVHLRYGYGFGLPARIAMRTYLATLGAGKVGFSTMASPGEGGPARRVGGLRGVLERNTLRYHLALDVALAVRDLPAAQQMPRAFALWFDATERHAEQLHELERADYLAIKQRALARQRTESPPARG